MPCGECEPGQFMTARKSEVVREGMEMVAHEGPSLAGAEGLVQPEDLPFPSCRMGVRARERSSSTGSLTRLTSSLYTLDVGS